MNPSFWRGKRVLVTGHTGFKGSWLSLWLQTAGAHVIGYSLDPPSFPSLFEAAGAERGMTSVRGDIRDLGSILSLCEQSRPEIVLHLAAQALVRASYASPVDTYATNVMGTAHVLEAVRQTPGVRAVVVVTSDKCYQNREWLWGYREDEAMGGHDPYSSSKGCAELVTAAYRRSFFGEDTYAQHGVAVASARAGNVIGGGDWAQDRLIPGLIQALEAGRPILLRNPEAIRPWQHVLEPLRGYLMLAEALYTQGPAFSGGWNFGPEEADARPVAWIAEALTRLWGSGARWEVDGGPHPHEARYLKLDCSKARTLLGWSPTLDLETTLKWIVAWHQGFHDQLDPRCLVTREIALYERMASC